MNNHELGRWGEQQAAAYLRRHKYQIIETNYRSCFGEIDLIATDGKYLVFVEVKTRTNNTYGQPREAVDHHKQQKIRQVARLFLVNSHNQLPVRFDVISVCLQGEREIREIRHFQNVF